jgi:hypothetical protein
MSNVKDTILAVFQKWGQNAKDHGLLFEAEAPAEVKFSSEATLQDGTKIYSTADAWAPGVDAFSQDADGNTVPLAEGDYTLEDGTVLSIGPDGMVAALTPVEVETEMSTEDIAKVLDSVLERVAALEASNSTLQTELAQEKNNSATVGLELAQVKEKYTKLKQSPAVASVREHDFARRKSESKAPVEETVAEMMERLRAKKK